MCPHLSPDDDAEDLDLRAHYRSTVSPELATASGASLRRQHGTWHPGWGIAGSVAVVFGLLVLTDYSSFDDASSMDDEEIVAQADLPEPDEALTQPPAIGSYTAMSAPALPASLTVPENGSPLLKQTLPPAGPDATSRIEYIRNLLRNNQQEAAVVQLAALHRDEAQLELPPDLQVLLPAAEALPETDQTESGSASASGGQ
ncbi:hypothetical protein ACLQ9F_00400 [Bordetella avium]|uniref:Uncharacterized protein n=1 Tax=Bordetella avium (strain 197N) TaxID=360910 RepID=Q2KXV1_BORA1|nr:hypothetical protein [Bordetella avium]CAJ50024.1 hypothetical protein BAV2414 [Bordetella avium 197N]